MKASQINDASIYQMVQQFYDVVRADPNLGPIFESRLHGRWSEHLDLMCDFWSSVLLASGRFSGNPRQTHADLSKLGVSPIHFDRWLDLFKGVLEQLFIERVAVAIYCRAEKMRAVLEPVTCKIASS